MKDKEIYKIMSEVTGLESEYFLDDTPLIRPEEVIEIVHRASKDLLAENKLLTDRLNIQIEQRQKDRS